MPNPTRSDVHVNAPLTNVSIAFLQAATEFVAAKVFPIVPVQKQSDRYFVYSKADFQRDTAQKRAPSTESAGGGFNIDNTPTYFADVFALHKDVDDMTRANADAAINMDRDATLFLTEQMLIRREKVFVTNAMATSVWTTDITGVASSPSTNQVLQWNDAASTPIEDITTYASLIKKRTGRAPNTLVLGQEVWDSLKNHPDVVDRIKYSGGVGNTRPAVVTKEAFAAIIEVDQVLVSGAVENTALEGVTASNSYIAGKTALLCYTNPNPSLMMPSAGYTFAWTGLYGAGAEAMRVLRYRMDHLRSDRVEAEMAFDSKVVSADLGVFFTAIVA